MFKCGLLGRAIMSSSSPRLHEEEARAQCLNLSYELFDFAERNLDDSKLGPLLRRLSGESYSGVNVTYPFKQAVVPLLDELAECATAVGAVNTVAMRSGRLIGYNTDKTGFQESLERGLPEVSLARVLQLGAGGAGSAVASALLSLGVGYLEIADIDLQKAVALAGRLCSIYGSKRVGAREFAAIDTRNVDGIVNATPMGMAANPKSAIAPELIQRRHWVADIVYFPLETEFLKIARERCCPALDGSGMVIGQAALAFEIFTGRKADKERMRQSFYSK